MWWLLSLLRQCAQGLVSLLVPDVCWLCGAELHESERGICKVCASTLDATAFETVRQNPMMVRMQDRVPIQSAFAGYYYRDLSVVRRLVHDFKYHGMFPIAEMLGHEMGVRAFHSGFSADYDVLIPVPLHPRRERSRGYNQSLHICKGFAQATGLEVRTDVLLRVRYEGSQTKLSANDRLANVTGEFQLAPSACQSMRGRRLLLVDDVFTTGATSEICLNELAKIPDVRLGVVTVGYRVRE